jgi:predicted transcriptional regulator
MPSMPHLSGIEMAALRFMIQEPLRITPFFGLPKMEEVASMLDGLAKKGLCTRTLEGLSRVYAITQEGVEIVSQQNQQP